MGQLVQDKKSANSGNDRPITIYLNSAMAAMLKGLIQKCFFVCACVSQPRCELFYIENGLLEIPMSCLIKAKNQPLVT